MTAFEQRMAEFHARFLVRAAEDADKIEAALADGDFTALRVICHGLSGNAGMFGFAELGSQAQAVEDTVDAGEPEASVRALASELLRQLAGVAQGR